VSFAAITLCVASQGMLIIVVFVHFVIDCVRELLDTPSHTPDELLNANVNEPQKLLQLTSCHKPKEW
jgi:hypothetical protein